MKYIISSLIEVRSSPIHGRGVFARTFIPEGTVLEEAPYIEVKNNPTVADYVFGLKTSPFKALVFGFGSIYNSALTKSERSASYEINEEGQFCTFKTTRDIQADEEILTFYGEKWIRQRVNFKSSLDLNTELEKLHLLNY